MNSYAKAASVGSIGEIGRRLGLFVLALTALLGVSAPIAAAAPTAQPGLGYQATFGAGDFVGTSGFIPVRNPVAVDSQGNILAGDEMGLAIRIYAPDASAGGTSLTTVDVSGPFHFPTGIAVDPLTDALYVSDGFNSSKVFRYVSDGQPTPTYTLDPTFGEPAGEGVPGGEGIVVDPGSHDLLIADPGAGAIRRYDTSGALVGTITTPSMSPQRIAVAPDGSIYVAQDSSPNVAHFSPAGTLLGEVEDVGSVRALAVNPVTGVLVAAVGERLKGYSPAGAFLFETKAPAGSASEGIVFAPGGERLYSYRNNEGWALEAYVPAIYPGADTPQVSAIEAHSVHVSAEVDPGDDDPGPGIHVPDGSAGHFEYSDDGGASWKSTPDQALSGAGTVEADLTGLLANFDYLVRFVAGNSLTSNTTIAVPFSTPLSAPTVVTDPATEIGETRAVLNGTVNPEGSQTDYYFEYGQDTDYGTRIPLGINGAVGDGRVAKSFSRTITSLTPGATYHYRIVAENSTGISRGDDRTFTTIASAAAVRRAYEQVTPVDKHGIAINSFTGFQAKADGNGFVYETRGSEGGATLFNYELSLRSGGTWNGGIDLTLPINPIFGITGTTTLAVSDDFSRAFVASNRKLTPDAPEEATNLYLRDAASGQLRLIATGDISGANGFISIQTADEFMRGAPDFSWIVFASVIPLKPDAPPRAIYRWSEDSGLELVSVPPSGPASTFFVGPVGSVRAVSADGSRIYFNAEGSEPGIYLWENGEVRPVSFSRISDDHTPKPGLFFGASDDGRYAFFQALEGTGSLTSEAPGINRDVYRYDAADDSLQYLGGVPAQDGGVNDMARNGVGVGDDGRTLYYRADTGFMVWRDGVLAQVTPEPKTLGFAAVSPNGRFVAFQGASSAVYLYDAETGQLDCASCRPDGSPAAGTPTYDYERFLSNRVPQSVTEDGQVFFTTAARLAAADVNGMKDVYMYQDGRHTLISPGDAPFEANLADISKDGSDVFFTTGQKLVGQDNDEAPDVYDARVGGGLAAQNPPARQECLRDDCKATPNAGPELPFGGSEALSGPGNVAGKPRKRCAKGAKVRKVKGKTRCVKPKKKKSAKRAANNGRQSR